jgi:predicted ribosome-associated RNA-binding protein Tma20
MTRKIMNVMLAGATLALLSGAPVLAQGILIANGLASNVLSSNVKSTNSAGLGRVVAVELPRR